MSIKQDTILADYGNEELLNESADVEWVNRVSILKHSIVVLWSSLRSSFWRELNLHLDRHPTYWVADA
jgi:hypothetical protein